MKKIILLFCLLSSFSAYCQTQFGIRIAPGVTFNGVSGGSYDQKATAGNAMLGGSIGPVVEFSLTSKGAFSMGLWYTRKGASILFNEDKMLLYTEGNAQYQQNFPNATSRYALSYLQLPVTFKFFSKPAEATTRLYIQVGGTLDWKIGETEQDTDQNFLFQVAKRNNSGAAVHKTVDVGAYAGIGLEQKLGAAHTLLIGLAYNGGLTNVSNQLQYVYYGAPQSTTQYTVRTQLVSLEAGIKF